MDIRMYRTADNPRNIQKYYTRDSSIVPGPFSNVDSAVFGPGSELDLSALKIDFEAVQEGSGDPSPENVRPIVGKTQATVNLRSGNEFSAVFKPFGDTYYGGTYDTVSGVLKATHKIIDLGTKSWTVVSGTASVFRTTLNDKIASPGGVNILCSEYRAVSAETTTAEMVNYDCKENASASFRTYFYIKNTAFGSDTDAARAGLSGVNLVYQLQTPQTYNIGALTGLNFFPGENRIWVSDMLINELAFTGKSGSAAIDKTNGFEVANAAFISENERRNPVLRILSDTDLTEYNYVYISEYDRFYFAEVTNLANGVYLIHCHLDLLMSCKDKIKALNCTVERSASDGSSYLADDQYPVNSYKKYITRLFPHAVDGNSYILMTVGNKIIEE